MRRQKSLNCKKIITFYIYTLFSKYDMIKYNDLNDAIIYIRLIQYRLPGESGKVIYMESKKRIKDIPSESRPYERCFSCGPHVLTDAELLAVIIRTGVSGIQSVELAEKIIHLTQNQGIMGLTNLSAKELISIKGVGMVKAVQIMCIAELSKRIAMGKRKEKLSFTEPQAVAGYFMEEMRHKEKEELKVLMLDAKSGFIAESTVSTGTVNFAVASPREIFLEALKYKAVNIIIMHNHPSGDPAPSQNDFLCTRKIKEAGELIGISLIDHIIIGDNKYMSFSEKNLL
jgi:DNA repair protein radc